MRQVKLLGLALIAVFASAVALASSASALTLPENLPVSATERAWTGGLPTGATAELLGGGLGKAVKCKEAPSSGTEKAGKPLGLFHIEFKNCTTENEKVICTGLGEASGVILTLGEWHLVFDKVSSTELLTAVLFLPEPVHFNCSALVLVQVTGTLVCLHLKPTESNVTHQFHCVVLEGSSEATEHQEDTKWCTEDKNNKCEGEKTAELTCTINMAATGKPCYELALGNVTYNEPIFADI